MIYELCFEKAIRIACLWRVPPFLEKIKNGTE
jgi:hypothetical protein